ncbi:MAG: T9SS type A sorting domain-containing protein [Bacteroidota bacterium]
MKKNYLLLLVYLFVQWSQAQIVNIPDANFLNILVNTNCADFDGNEVPDGDVDTNDDGMIQVSEALAVLKLIIRAPTGSQAVSSTEGLQAFENLTKLNLFETTLGGLSTINYPSSLDELSLSVVFGSGNTWNLGNLDFTTTTFKRLTVNDGGVQLGSVNFTNNPNIRYITIGSVSTTINALHVTNCSNLSALEISSLDLMSLDLTGCMGINYINASNNLFESIDLSSIRTSSPYLIFDVNPNLLEINAKNGTFDLLSVSNCPSLAYMCMDNDTFDGGGSEAAQYSQQYPAIVINSYCSLMPSGDFITVEGSNIFDINTDGCDHSDPAYPNMEYQISNGSVTETVVANPFGDYTIYLPEDETFTITPQLENPTYFTVSPTSITVDTATASNPTIQDFCVIPNGIYNDVEVTIMPLDGARPGFDTNYKIVYTNKGNTILSGSVQLTFDDDLMDLVNANPMTDSQATNTLMWNYTNLSPFESSSIDFTMNINSPIEVPAVNGDDVLAFEATINQVVGDETPSDNIMVLQQIVVNSFDPNDISCLEGETVTTDYVDAYVHYLIRFENTGTASAVNVVVTDEIDTAKFDIATLKPVSSSHAMVTTIKNGNKVEFIFENINLPFDDATNDGYLVFKIKTRSSLIEGNTFANTADIYFDFNFPITTNTATTNISNGLRVSEVALSSNALLMYPNPAKDRIQITSKYRLQKLILYTLDGKSIMEKDYTDVLFSTSLDVSSLSEGMYVVQVETTNEIYTRKMMKQ